MVFGRCLDHESAVLICELINPVVRVLLKVGPTGRVGHWGCDLEGCVLIPGPSLLPLTPGCPWVSSVYHAISASGPGDLRPNLLIPPLSGRCLVFCSNNGKVTQ